MHLTAAQEFHELNTRYGGEVASASRASGLALMLYDTSAASPAIHFLHNSGIPESVVTSYSSQWFTCDPLLPDAGCHDEVMRHSSIVAPANSVAEANEVYFSRLGRAGFVEAAALSRPLGRSFHLVVGLLAHRQQFRGSLSVDRVTGQVDQWLAQGSDYLVDACLHIALHRPAAPPVAPVAPVSMTRREQQLVNELLRGSSNKQIAADLHLSIYTIENYLSRLYRKFAVHSRTALLAALRQSAAARGG